MPRDARIVRTIVALGARAPGAALLFLFFLSLVGAAPAVAQVPAITVIRLFSDDPNHARLYIGISSPARVQYSKTSTGYDVSLPGTALSRSVTAEALHGRGLISDVEPNVLPDRTIFHIRTLPDATMRIERTNASVLVFVDAPEIQTRSGARSATATAAATAKDDEPDYEVIFLKYADVSEIAGILSADANVPSNDVFAPMPSIFGSTQATLGLSAPPTTQSVQSGDAATRPLGQHVDDTISVDRRLNAIIVSGTAARVQRIKKLIATLDVPLRGVLFETQVIELSETAAKNIGIDFTNGAGQLATGSLTVKSLQLAQGELNFQAAIYAQIAKGNGKILATPKIMALNGSSASILTGDALPITTSVVFGTTNAIQQQVQYVNVGVNLQILPRVSEDIVTSHIFAEVSSVTGFTQAGLPQISERQANTTAVVRDGLPFLIGGLIRDSELTNMQKIPLLGDLPLLGQIFRYNTSTRQKSTLVIVVTPHIVNPQAQK